MRAVDITCDQHRRQAVFFRHDDVGSRCVDGWRHDHAIGAELQQRVDEGALLVELVVVIRKQEGLPAAIQLVFDGAQDLGIERVHDVMHDNADDAGARSAQRRGTTVVDIADLAGVFLDLLTGRARHQRAVAQRQGNSGRGDAERIGNGRKLDLLCQRSGLPLAI